jgi:hypothetical protein
MKKLITAFVIFVVLLLLISYFIIPSQIKISATVLVNANTRGSYRCLADNDKWEQVTGKKMIQDSFSYNNQIFKINRESLEDFQILMNTKDSSLSTLIEVLPLNIDSSIIKWGAVIESSVNPISRILQYFEAISIKRNMASLLEKWKTFLEQKENVYGIHIVLTQVKDTSLVAIKTYFKSYPSDKEVDSLIDILRNYIKQNNAQESGYPMLNIKPDNSNFETMVAVPVNKLLNDHGVILQKQMVPGKILVAEVRGGHYTVSKSFIGLLNYVKDRDLQSPAIPFESLITDRALEPDTTKWITKIYYPIY